MPAVAERPAVNPGKDEAMIRRQLAAAAGRIRLVDVLTGGLAVLALVLGYAAIAIILDKWIVFPLPPDKSASPGSCSPASALSPGSSSGRCSAL